MAELEIRNLHVRAGEKEILKGLDLKVETGKVHALMGPNGSGKSTLANVIMGHPNLEVTEGEILFDGEDITEAEPDERARMGLFMAFQYPVAVPGVTVTKYLRTFMNAHREAQGLDPVSLKDFRKTVEAAMQLTEVPREFTTRYLNEGFSGGEKKRMDRIYRESNANIHRGVYPLAQEATEDFEGARLPLADWIGSSLDETIFT